MSSLKKKQKTGLIVGLSAVVLLGGTYAAVEIIGNKREAAEASRIAAESSLNEENKQIFSFDPDDVRKLSFKNSEGTFAFTRDGETMEWTFDDTPELPLRQNNLGYMAECISEMEIAKTVEENAQELSNYGLDAPQYEAWFTLADGTEEHLMIGMRNSAKDQYYFLREGSSDVILIPNTLINYVDDTLKDIVSVEEATIPESGMIIGIDYSRKDGKGWKIIALDNSEKKYNYYPYIGWYFKNEDGDVEAADVPNVTDLIAVFCQTSLNSTAYYLADETNMAQCGFSKDGGENGNVTLQYFVDNGEKDEEGKTVFDTEQMTLYIGKQVFENPDDPSNTTSGENESASAETTEAVPDGLPGAIPDGDGQKKDERYYVMVEGKNAIYYANAANVSELVNARQNDFYNTNYASVLLADIDSCEIRFQDEYGNMRQLSVGVEKHIEHDEENDKDVTVSEYTMNGTKVDNTYFTSIYYKLIAMKSDRAIGEEDTPVEYAPELEILYNTSIPDFPHVVIGYTPYDDSFYQVTINGKDELLINKRDVAAMISDLTETLNVQLPAVMDLQNSSDQ